MMRYLFVFALPLFIACHSNKEEESESNSSPIKDTLSSIPAAISHTKANCTDLFNSAKRMDSTILKQMDLNVDLANKAIKAFTDYAFYCENDSVSPVYLIKSAQIAISINNSNQAKIVLDRCISNYPKFKNKPAAIFLLAQLYDEQHLLNNEEEAKKLYEQLIFDYPKSEWAASAKGALKLLGKTDQEIINEFNKKNKK